MNRLIVYGDIHGCYKELIEPRISKHAIGIDTGCVYGNKLSAIIFDHGRQNYKIESVRSEDV